MSMAAQLAQNAATMDGAIDGMESWEWSDMSDAERKKFSTQQAKEHRKYIQHAQRELHRQREMVANLRAENALLRNKYQSKMAEQNDVLEEKHTQQVNHLMNIKYEIEELVEADLERLDQQKRQLRALASKVKALTLADKSNLYDEREHDRTRKRHMDNVEKFASKHSQEVTYGKQLRETVNELRHDKMNVKKKMQEKTAELDQRSAEAVQLINIANEFYTQRAQYRLAASALIAEAGKEAEDHRAKMQELNNRIEYYDLVMQEREEEYQKSLLEAERQASNLNDPSEEIKEAEKKRQQELIEAFDKLMHSFGVWDADQLVSRFLAKEDKMLLARNYCDALLQDADKIDKDIKQLNAEAKELEERKPEQDAQVLVLKDKMAETEVKSAALRRQADESLAQLDLVNESLANIKSRMATCSALQRVRPVVRRWTLLRANLRRIPYMGSSDAKRSQGLAAKVPAAKFDPRRKTMLEEFNEPEVAPQGLEALVDVALIEQHTMLLLAEAQLGWQHGNQKQKKLTRPIEKPVDPTPELDTPLATVKSGRGQGKQRQKKSDGSVISRNSSSSDLTSLSKSLSATRRTGSRQSSPSAPEDKEAAAAANNDKDAANDVGLFPGPRDAVADARTGRAIAHVVPSLKEIETPRELEPLSPEEIRRQVRVGGHSEKVGERLRRLSRNEAEKAKTKGTLAKHASFKTGMGF